MFLVYDKILIVRSANSIGMYKKCFDDDHNDQDNHKNGDWEEYHTFEDMRGQISFQKGNVRIQITTQEKVFFYIIDADTLMPKLENVMYNFMQCQQLLFGSRVRFGISYKTNQSGFIIYTRKYFHNFKV